MAWIEYHTALRDHWKIKRLADSLGIDYCQALGHVSCLWLWCAEYSKTGDLRKFSDDEIRFASRCTSENFTKNLLCTCGLLTKGQYINDWGKHGLKLLESKRKANREYARRNRKSGYPLGTDSVAIPYHTIPNHTNNKKQCASGDAPRFPFDEIWEKYPNRVGKKQAFRFFKASVKTDQDWVDIQAALGNYNRSERVGKGFVQNGSTWFNNWRDWINPAEGVLNADVPESLRQYVRKK